MDINRANGTEMAMLYGPLAINVDQYMCVVRARTAVCQPARGGADGSLLLWAECGSLLLLAACGAGARTGACSDAHGREPVAAPTDGSL